MSSAPLRWRQIISQTDIRSGGKFQRARLLREFVQYAYNLSNRQQVVNKYFLTAEANLERAHWFRVRREEWKIETYILLFGWYQHEWVKMVYEHPLLLS